MTPGRWRFGPFTLDPDDRRLWQDGAPVEINARYLDALALLVREAGHLVSKDRFLEEVWRGVPVTDEALTQCIKTLRRQLGDDAARPRYIETVPKHGYRFIAPVERDQYLPGSGPTGVAATTPAAMAGKDWRQFWQLGAAGTLGGGTAGMIGGLFYGFAAAAQPLQPGTGASSVLLVTLCITTAVALIGACGVAFGIAAAGFAATRRGLWTIIGGAGGGLIVGALVKLVGLDAFNLLFGQAPRDITGAAEGVLLGGAVGIAAWLNCRRPLPQSLRRSMAVAGAVGALAGLAIALLGGRLMAGSLDLLARQFDSRLRLDQIGALVGESGFGPVSLVATGALEGALFAACIVGTMMVARDRMRATD